MEPSRYTGIAQFGPAYQVMLARDPHAPGSVDCVLVHRMVRLCADTAEWLYTRFTATESRYQVGSRPELERRAREATAGCATDEERVAGIAAFCAALQRAAPQALDEMVLGGTEEAIISRGSDWCTDVARVGSALCQVAGIAARLVCLADVEQAYSGHAIVEAYRGGAWGAVDTSTNVVYRHGDGRPASTWDLMADPALIEAHGPAPYTSPGQFRRAALSSYYVWESSRYDYSESRPNDYYRSILDTALKGWPGGLRWLHGEDGACRSK